MKLNQYVQVIWYSDGLPSRLLQPLAKLYEQVVRYRRHSFLNHPPDKVDVPIIVVGNISVGGTGKTPMVIWLCEWLRQQGWKPGVVSRGYGSEASHKRPRLVETDDDPAKVGDESLLIAKRTGVPVAVGRDRASAVQELLVKTDCDIVISDDGLQHYRLWRDLEIAMLDGTRRLGNGRCLPAGPLREPPERLSEVDFVMVTEGKTHPGEYAVRLRMGHIQPVNDSVQLQQSITEFSGKRVHAVAGIGNPERFFRALEQNGLHLIRHPLPDHHRFTPSDLEFGDGYPVFMTEKDAVKCQTFAANNVWYVPIDALPEKAWIERLTERLRSI